MGKGKDTSSRQDSRDHVSRPITTLKDPSTFGPPPRKVDYNGGAASSRVTTPISSGLGAPLTADEIREQEVGLQREATEEQGPQKPKPPPVPFRADTTGLSTSNLPKPPVRRLEQEVPPRTSTASPSSKPKPSLPPRLPPRQNSHPTASAIPRPPPNRSPSSTVTPQKNHVNQGTLDRLGSAGVSVPGLGIGKRDEPENPWQDQESTSTSTTVPATQSQGSQFRELQSRFSKVSASSPTLEQPAQGTSFVQKQSALKTANSFRNDPSSVTLADAKSAALTANNFRERHGEQVATGLNGATNLGRRYGIADKFNGYTSNGPGQPAMEPSPSSPGYELPHSSSGFKKNAPQFAPKTPFLDHNTAASPPPVPHASRPK